MWFNQHTSKSQRSKSPRIVNQPILWHVNKKIICVIQHPKDNSCVVNHWSMLFLSGSNK